MSASWRMSLVLGLWVAMISPRSAVAHGPISDQINALNGQIARTPDDASLYLSRARLYMADEHWRHGVADLRRALAKDPSLVGAYYFLGQAQLARGRTRGAVTAARRFLAGVTDENSGGRFRGYMLLASAQAVRGAYGEAIRAYERGFATAREARPEHYLGHAGVLAELRRFDDALLVLDHGLRHLGPVRSLQLKSLELLTLSAQTHRHLQLLTELATAEPNNWDWHRRRAQLRLQLGDVAGAVHDYEAALRTIGGLNPRRRRARAIQAVRTEIEHELLIARRRQVG